MRAIASKERDRALQRIEAALVEQDRLGERFEAAVGTATELGAYVRLRAAGDQVAARGAWLSWIDDEGYRGLNAGPFELLAESDRRLGRAIEARSESASRRVGRAWLDGREVDGTDPRFAHVSGARERIGELRSRARPEPMARELSEDARRRGL